MVPKHRTTWGGKSRTHNWLPKIIFWLINMTMVNAYRIYKALVTTRTPDRQCLTMKEAIKELTFLLMQQGTPVQRREASHPNPKVDMSRILGWTIGKKVRSDKKKQVAPEAGFCQEVWSGWCHLANIQKKSPWRTHQSVGAKKKVRGKCCWGKCPRLKVTKAKRPRSYNSMMVCKECSAKTGSNIWLCSGQKANDVLPCHIDYHKRNYNIACESTGGD